MADPDLPDQILAVLPTDPRAQFEIGWRIMQRAFAARGEVSPPQAAPDIADKIRNTELRLEEANSRLSQALEQNVIMEKRWDEITKVLKKLLGSFSKDGRVSNLEEFNKLLAATAGLKDVVAVFSDGIDDDMDAENIISLEPKDVHVDGASFSLSIVTEDEIISTLSQSEAPMTTDALVDIYRSRLKSLKAKRDFTDILRRTTKISKSNGLNYVVLKETRRQH